MHHLWDAVTTRDTDIGIDTQCIHCGEFYWNSNQDWVTATCPGPSLERMMLEVLGD
jgi:hypothetical protein